MNAKVKSILFATMLVALVVLAVMGWRWEELANSPFWWTFWPIAAVAAIPAFIFLVIWFDKSRKKW